MASLVETFDPAYYPWWTLNYFLIIWLLSKLVEFGLSYSDEESIKSKFRSLSTEKSKNVVTYIVEIVVTTFAFVAQILGGTGTLFREEALYPSTPEHDLVLLSLQAVAILYIWELVYRERFGWPLLIHHLITLLFIQLVTVSFATEHHIAYLRLAIAMGFHATTEQASFFALYCYRLEIYSSHTQGHLLWLASGMAFLIKSAVTIGGAVYYFIVAEDSDSNAFRGSNWGVFWRYCFLPLLAGLFCSQLYACKILFDLGNARIQRGLRESKSTNCLTTKQDNKVKEDPEIGSGAAEPRDVDHNDDHHDGETHCTDTTVAAFSAKSRFSNPCRDLDEGGDDDDDAEDDIQRKHPDCSNTPLDV